MGTEELGSAQGYPEEAPRENLLAGYRTRFLAEVAKWHESCPAEVPEAVVQDWQERLRLVGAELDKYLDSHRHISAEASTAEDPEALVVILERAKDEEIQLMRRVRDLLDGGRVAEWDTSTFDTIRAIGNYIRSVYDSRTLATIEEQHARGQTEEVSKEGLQNLRKLMEDVHHRLGNIFLLARETALQPSTSKQLGLILSKYEENHEKELSFRGEGAQLNFSIEQLSVLIERLRSGMNDLQKIGVYKEILSRDHGQRLTDAIEKLLLKDALRMDESLRTRNLIADIAANAERLFEEFTYEKFADKVTWNSVNERYDSLQVTPIFLRAAVEQNIPGATRLMEEKSQQE